MSRHIIPAEAHMCKAHVKPQGGGRSQNYMPPEAKHALEEAQKARGAQ